MLCVAQEKVPFTVRVAPSLKTWLEGKARWLPHEAGQGPGRADPHRPAQKVAPTDRLEALAEVGVVRGDARNACVERRDGPRTGAAPCVAAPVRHVAPGRWRAPGVRPGVGRALDPGRHDAVCPPRSDGRSGGSIQGPCEPPASHGGFTWKRRAGWKSRTVIDLEAHGARWPSRSSKPTDTVLSRGTERNSAVYGGGRWHRKGQAEHTTSHRRATKNAQN